MKFPLFNLRKPLAAQLVMLLACVLTLSSLGTAQSLWGSGVTKKSATQDAEQVVLAPLAESLFQCANGKRGTAELPCADGNWQFGNLNQNNSQWVEGEFVPYRALLTGFTTGSTGNTLTITYATTNTGKHAIDFLGTWDQSTLAPNGPGGADACVNVSPCSAPTTFPIPADPILAAANPGLQTPGNFTIWNGTITSVSAYTTTGTYAGTSDTSITITFTANNPNVVIAWGGHISSRVNWTLTGTAISISGAPYHTSINGGPNRSLQVDAAILPAFVIVIKEVTTFGAPPGTTATFAFNFTYTPSGGVAVPFSLVDDVVGPGGGGTTINTLDPDATEVFQIQNFSDATPNIAATVTEATHPQWTLGGIVCTEISGGLPNILDTTTAGRTANIIAQEAEVITCTFQNTQFTATAAPASITGRAVDSFGRGISGARISVMDAQTGEFHYAMTNSFGYYTITDTEVGNFYVMTISHRRYTFADDTRTFSLHDNLAGMDFIANP
jgi:hypothetical protein